MKLARMICDMLEADSELLKKQIQREAQKAVLTKKPSWRMKPSYKMPKF